MLSPRNSIISLLLWQQATALVIIYTFEGNFSLRMSQMFVFVGGTLVTGFNDLINLINHKHFRVCLFLKTRSTTINNDVGEGGEETIKSRMNHYARRISSWNVALKVLPEGGGIEMFHHVARCFLYDRTSGWKCLQLLTRPTP